MIEDIKKDIEIYCQQTLEKPYYDDGIDIITLFQILDKYKEEHICSFIEEEIFDGDTAFTCNNCEETWCGVEGSPQENNFNYCPNCGFKISKTVYIKDMED